MCQNKCVHCIAAFDSMCLILYIFQNIPNDNEILSPCRRNRKAPISEVIASDLLKTARHIACKVKIYVVPTTKNT